MNLKAPGQVIATAHTNANGHGHSHGHGLPRTHNAARIPPGVLNLNKKTAKNLNNLSLSCPDLNLNQVLFINATDKKLIPLNSVNKPLQNKLLQQKLIPANLRRPLAENKVRRASLLKSKKQTLQEKTIANTIKNSGHPGLAYGLEKDSVLSLHTLKDYNDNIIGMRIFWQLKQGVLILLGC